MGYRLSWTHVSHATAYKLQYSLDGSGYVDLATTENNYYDLSGISAGGDYVLSVISQATGYTDSDRATIEYKPRAVSYTLTNCNASLQKTVTQYGATFPSFSISPASGYNFGTGATYSVYNGTTPVTLTVSDGIIAVPEFTVGGAVTVNVSAVSAGYPVSGTWLFAESVAFPDGDGSQNVSFSSNAVQYTTMSWESNGIEIMYMYYDSTNIYHRDDDMGYNAWESAAYRTVDFGATPQMVSQAFYTWFTSTATQQ